MQVWWSRRIVRPRRLAEKYVGAAGEIDESVAGSGVAAVNERRPGRIGDPHPVGLGRVADQPRLDVQRADPHGLPVNPMSDVENVAEVVDLSAFRRRRGAKARPRLLRAEHQAALGRGRRMVTTPDEQAGKVE